MATSSEPYVGIDVSKDRLDIAVLGERQEQQMSNTQQGIAEVVQWMKELQPEATSELWWRPCFMLGYVWQW